MVRYRKINYIVSGILVLLSLVSLLIWGLKAGIDFTGGSLIEIAYPNGRPAIEKIQQSVDGLNFGKVHLQLSGDKDIFIRLKDLSAEEHQRLLVSLAIDGSHPEEARFDSIGPVIGNELRQKSWLAVGLVVVMIVLYIAWAFRRVSKPVSSWKYGVAAVLALIHDVAIPSGVFAALGHFQGVEIDILFITALLTTLGFSVHDTIVVFDRIRENLKKNVGQNFEDTVEKSIRQTVVRSINTSLTVILVLVSILMFGPASVKYFVLTLLLGVTFGTYSSIFIASPILVSWHQWKEKRKAKK